MDRRTELEQRWQALQKQLEVVRRLPPEETVTDLKQLEARILERLEKLEIELGNWS